MKSKTTYTFQGLVLVSAGCVLLALAGCATSQNASSGPAARSATPGMAKQIEIFKDGAKPTRPYVELGSLADDARLEEEPAIEAKMKKAALKMGGDALIFEPKSETGFDVHPWGWGAKKSYLYKARVVKYQ